MMKMFLTKNKLRLTTAPLYYLTLRRNQRKMINWTSNQLPIIKWNWHLMALDSLKQKWHTVHRCCCKINNFKKDSSGKKGSFWNNKHLQIRDMMTNQNSHYKTFSPRWIFFHPGGSPGFDKLLQQTSHELCRFFHSQNLDSI